jgi:hypothetical protein
MTKFFTNKAASAYLLACRTSYFSAIIDRTVFLSRMKILQNVTDISTPQFKYAMTVLNNEKINEEVNWEDFCRDFEVDIGKYDRYQVVKDVIGQHLGKSGEDNGNIMAFVSSNGFGLSRKWHFRPSDPDPNPSVPHGHDVKQNKRKLDAYHGFIFLNGVSEDRESRDSIIRLWNDNNFRVFALESIIHFIKNNPSRRWPVAKPKELPGIRGGKWK